MTLVIWPQQPDEWVAAIRDAAGAHDGDRARDRGRGAGRSARGGGLDRAT